MNDIQVIQNKIYEVRGMKVMLDFDLAAMYRVETKVLNQAVKRNIERFPEDFMFQLTKGEYEIFTNFISMSQITTDESIDNQQVHILKSQFVTSRFLNKTNIEDSRNWGGSRKMPYAFTENGVAMLSSVLRSPLAIQVNIGIMRAFTEFRRIALQPLPDNNAELRKEIQAIRDEMNDILHDQNDINESTRAQLDAISTALAELQADKPRMKPRRKIGFVQDEE